MSVVPDVAIVSYDTGDYLLQLLQSLTPLATRGEIAAVHVWDNGSRDRTPDLLERFAAAHGWLRPWRSPVNVHHGPALDALLRHACGADWALVLDADTVVRGSLAPALAHCKPDVAFVGQIHPQMPQLYAYLAHLLVHRPTYLQLPPFCHHGAPGIDFFAAVSRERRPYVRFRWVDAVHHAGQGSLRRVAASGDRSHEFYAFAREEATATPISDERRRHEGHLTAALNAFLAAPHASAVTRVEPAPPHSARTHRRHRDWRDRVRLALLSPRRARALARARKLGLDLIAEEAAGLAAVIERHRPHRVVEVDTVRGGMLALCAGLGSADVRLVSVGLPPWELDDPGEPAERRKLENASGSGARVSVLRGCASDAAMRRDVQGVLAGSPIDLLVLSGEHSYTALSGAFDAYSRMVGDDGLLVIPDIHPHSRGWGGDGPRFWEEIRDRYRHLEIVADEAQDGFGIGVLYRQP